ncbi:MAG: hypothetical protein ACYTGW_11350, partial [Planctomycetota bacterium]
ESFARARSQDRDAAALQRFAGQLRAQLAHHYADRLRAAGTATLATVLAELSRDRTGVPGLLEEKPLAAALRQRADGFHGRLMAAFRQDGVAAALRCHQEIPALLAEHGKLSGVRHAMETLARALDARERGDLQGAVDCLRLAATELGLREVEQLMTAVESELEQAASALWTARGLAASGKLMAAREALLDVLEKRPSYQPARRELEILNQQAQDRDERLSRARALAAEARLKGASVLLLELAKDDEQGQEARLLLKDVQARMDLVTKGLAQVRRALHGQASSSAAGLRHCLARLDELTRVQADADDVQELRQALLAEIAGLESLERLGEAVAAERPADAIVAMAEFLPQRAAMEPPQRLDARLVDLADTVLQRAEAAVQGARLNLAKEWLEILKDLPGEHVELIQRRDSCGVRVRGMTARSEDLLVQANEAIAAGNVDRAEAKLAAAREIWLDCPAADQAAESLRQAHSQCQQLSEVERLTGSKDYAEAERKLRDLPPTPQFLRTRIFDIKQGLAKAQGLAQGFILRVDEGGEYLVLRSDSFTIGNVRDRWADVQLLAKIAGRHARISRSMSFHGGMEDKVIAERGDVLVNGEPVKDAGLRSGDEIGLGRTLSMLYTIPTKRSLSALLTLKGGFQVAGTDKLVMLKDRGRDGRILIGRSADCHIRVPEDGPEIEIYGAQDGQIRVRFAGKGEMDGRPFSGEHPVTAGAVVRCGAVSMVLQPWLPAS